MADKNKIELAVIGSGPGGFAAASLAADLGIKVMIIEQDPFLGGVCLHKGCIPAKALLHASKIIPDSRGAKNFGITFSEPSIDISVVRSWKENILKKLSSGLTQLAKKRNITIIQGKASFNESSTLSINKSNGNNETVKFEKAIIATGSKPITLEGMSDMPNAIDSTGALELKDIPKTLLVVGGGYIGLELGSVYAHLGSKVTVVEMTQGLLLEVDRDLMQQAEKRLKNTFNSIKLNTKATPEIAKEFEKVFVAAGRRPDASGLRLENTKIKTDEKGFIKINEYFQTDDNNIYAIGDIAGEPMLAHKASSEGKIAAMSIFGKKIEFKTKTIPAVVFTDPEIAWCGLTETEANKKNIKVSISKFPWTASGRSATLNRSDGVTKFIIEPKTEKILGVGIAGPGAGELIAEGVVAIEKGATARELSNFIHPHPTLSETIQNAAEVFLGECANFYMRKK